MITGLWFSVVSDVPLKDVHGIFQNLSLESQYLKTYIYYILTYLVSQIHIDFNITNYGKFSMRYRGAIVWNSLPSEIRNKFLESFQKIVKTICSKENDLY